MSEAKDTFNSCQPGLDHPSSKLSISICLWSRDVMHNLSGNGSWNSRCRAVADAAEPSRRAINESAAFTHRSKPRGRQGRINQLGAPCWKSTACCGEKYRTYWGESAFVLRF